MKIIKKKILTLLVILQLLFSCKAKFSFTGVQQLNDDYKYYFISNFENNSNSGPANLTNLFTVSLIDYFDSQTKLKFDKNNSNIELSGYIKKYIIEPITITENAESAQNRVTLIINVKVIDKINIDKSFEQDFSSNTQYDSNKDIESVENELLEKLFENINILIYNKTLGNW